MYSKSLERHLYTTTGGDTDFTNVTSLRGVFITSVLAEDKSVQSVVSFDQGGEWVPLRKPENSKCDATAKDPDKCSLHIHAAYSIAMKLNVPMLPLTEPNAVGLILAHGSVGDAISVMRPDVYVSDDGGYTWIKALNGAHHYAILDSGGLLVAVEYSSSPINKIKFSTDEGQCWRVYNFTKEPIYFTGLASEPGARSMNVSVWGYKTLSSARTGSPLPLTSGNFSPETVMTRTMCRGWPTLMTSVTPAMVACWATKRSSCVSGRTLFAGTDEITRLTHSQRHVCAPWMTSCVTLDTTVKRTALSVWSSRT